jgi:PAS domain S-box-containing protein
MKNVGSHKIKKEDEILISVLQSLPTGVIIYTLNNIVFANNAAFTILKFDKKLANKINQLSIFDFLLPEFHSTVKNNAKLLFQGKAVVPKIYQLKNQKGQLFHIEVKSNALIFNGQKAIQAIFTDVTERIKNEQILIQNNQTFNLLSKNYSDVIFKYDFLPNPHVSYISDSVYKLLGRKPNEIYSDSTIFMNQIHKDDVMNYVNTIQDYVRVTKNNKINKAVFRFFHKNGKLIYVEVSVGPIYNDNNKLIGMIGVMRDVTSEKTEDLLRKETEEKFRLIAQNANDIIFFYTYQPKPKYLFVSPSIKKVLGFTPEECYKDPFLGYKLAINQETYKKSEQEFSKKQKQKTLKQTTIVCQYSTKDGRLVWLEDNYSPIYDEEGNIKYILGISRDITKEKNYQLELEKKWHDYKLLIDTSPIGIFIHNGYCLYCNKTAASILEVSNPENLIGKNLIDYIIPELRERGKKRIKLASEGIDLHNLEYTIRTEKGKLINVELKTVPFVFNGQKCVQTIISNLSSEKKLARETLRAELAEEVNKKLLTEIEFRKKIQQELVVQTSKYEAIFNDTSHLIWTVNKKLQVTSFNKNYQEYIKKIYNYQLSINDGVTKIINPNNKVQVDLWISKYKSCFNYPNNKKVEFFEVQNIDKKGQKHYREVYLHPIFNPNGTVDEIAIIAQDVSERKRNEQKIIDQAAKLNAIFESGEQLIWTVDRNYFFTSFNKNFENSMFNLYKIKPTLERKIYNPHKSLKGKKHHEFWLSKYQEVFETKKSIEFTTEQTDKLGKKYFRQVFINPIFSNNMVNEISCTSNDVTELYYLQNQSIHQAAKLNSIFDSSSHLIWTVDKEFKATSYNKNFSDTFYVNYGVQPSLDVELHKCITNKHIQRDYQAYWYDLYNQVLNGNSLKFERKQISNDGKLNFKEIYLNPIRNKSNEIIEIACLAHDITENKLFEQQILQQSAKLKAIFESGNQLMWTITKDMRLTSFNKNYAQAIYDLYEFYPEAGKSIRELSHNKTILFESFWDEKYNVAFSGKQIEFTTERIQKNGKKVFRQYYLYPIINHNNQIIEVSGLGFDITENKLNEERISQSLKEKEVLLKEVHHRVKNNMQVISSILNLQSSYVKDDYAYNLLKECQNRVKTMAFIHESLYQTKNFESVNFSEYITTLSKNLVHTYAINAKNIKLVLTLDELQLNIDLSIPCGLVINEIISNSLKYAFPNNRDGIIFVTLKKINNLVHIEVGDNGIGIPDEIDIKQTKTLGLQLVDTLIEQINGKLVINRVKGTKFSIEFNL